MIHQFASSPERGWPDEVGAELAPLLVEAARVSRSAITITDAQLDPPGPVVVWINEAFERLTGYRSDQIIGRNPRLLQGPATDRAVLDGLRARLQRGEDFEGEAINYRADGTPFVMSWRISAIRDGDGVARHYVAIQDDVTTLRLRDHEERQATLALQDILLPSLPARIGHFDVGHAYRPAERQRIGGDWVDVIALPDGSRTLVVVGDVTGHGAPAVAAMGQLRWGTQAAALAGLSLDEVMATLRRLAAAQDLVATLLLVVIDESGSFEYLCAGHPPALVVDRDGSVRELTTTTPLLGPSVAGAVGDKVVTACGRLGPGECLVAYTDGLIERRHRSIDAGLAQLRDVVVRQLDAGGAGTARDTADASALAQGILTAMTAEGAGEDDIALLVLRCPPA